MIESLTEPPPAVGWASGPLGEVQREIARQTAREARALAAFAATRPASADRPAGVPGAMSAARRAARPQVLADVSEWAADEVALACAVPTVTAQERLERALILVHRLPKTLDGLESGLLHIGHLFPLLEKLGSLTEAKVRGPVETDVLAWMAARSVTTPAQLAAKIRRELLKRRIRDTARDLEQALRTRGVRVRPDRTDGMAVLEALLTVPEAEALLDALGKYADALDDSQSAGPPRTRAQKMADCLLDLVLRPGEHDLPAVRAQLTLVAPVATMAGGDAPGEVGAHPVPAEVVRALAVALGLVPAADPGPGAVAAAGSCWVDEEDVDPAVLAAAEEAAEAAWWADVEVRLARGEWPGGDDPPPAEQQRLWEQTARELAGDPDEAAWLGGDPEDDDVLPLPRPAAPDTAESEEPSWWAAADAAVEEAGAAQLAAYRALTRARRAVRLADGADTADEDAGDQSLSARMTRAGDTLTALTHATAAQRAALTALLQRTAGGGLLDRPRIAVTDALTGALLALTDAPDLRAAVKAGRGLGPPPDCDTYRPGAALDRFLRARDRRCRQPGCRNRVPRGGELDHDRPWPDGPTSATNMNGFCVGHHRGKHQAPGWTYDLTPDGTLTVTTPTGMTATTDPPPF